MNENSTDKIVISIQADENISKKLTAVINEIITAKLPQLNLCEKNELTAYNDNKYITLRNGGILRQLVYRQIKRIDVNNGNGGNTHQLVLEKSRKATYYSPNSMWFYQDD